MSTTTAKKAAAPAKGATLASMAAKTAPATAPAAAEKPKVEFDWSQEFEPVKVKVYTRNESPSIDYEAETPAFVKERVTTAYTKTMEALAAGNKRPVWVDQNFAKAEYVEEFHRLARRYAAFKGWTYRQPTEKNPAPSKTLATFAVKPKETRTKKPAPAANTVAA